jgi:hypothetical protein
MLMFKGSVSATINVLVALKVINLTAEQLAAIDTALIAYMTAFGASAASRHPGDTPGPRADDTPTRHQP